VADHDHYTPEHWLGIAVACDRIIRYRPEHIVSMLQVRQRAAEGYMKAADMKMVLTDLGLLGNSS
jgi:hypothetical protein